MSDPAAWGPVFVPLIALVGALVQIARSPDRSAGRRLEIALVWGLVVAVGVGEIVTAGSHLVAPAATAAQIGFPAGNPFQWEVACANLAFAVLGVACYWQRGGFWTATVAGYLVYFWGCGVGHVYQYVVNGNVAPYNWGPLVPVVFLVPLVLAVLLVALHRAQPATASTAAAPSAVGP